MLRGLLWFAVATGGTWGDQVEDGVVLLQTTAKVVASSEKPSHVKAVQTSHAKSSHRAARNGHREHHKSNHRSEKLIGSHHKKLHSKDADAGEGPEGIGAQAELSKEGYEQVVAEKDNEQMTVFLSRVAESDLNFTVSKSQADKPAIAGLVPYYSGVKAARGYGQLQAELKRLAKVDGSWVIPRGVAASMDEVGFKKVALLEDVQEMSEFIERLAHEKADSVVDDQAALKKFAKSVLKKGRFDAMRQKLIDVTKDKKGWLKREHPWINLMELS